MHLPVRLFQHPRQSRRAFCPHHSLFICDSPPFILLIPSRHWPPVQCTPGICPKICSTRCEKIAVDSFSKCSLDSEQDSNFLVVFFLIFHFCKFQNCDIEHLFLSFRSIFIFKNGTGTVLRRVDQKRKNRFVFLKFA